MEEGKSSADLKHEIGHVLFIDLVGYSKLVIEEQKKRLGQLTEIVLGATQVSDVPNEQLVRLPTGDGMALVFRNSTEEPAQCAFEIAQALKGHPEIELRMGIHSGPVSEVTDVNGRTNIAGAGINMAQRVMDCGDAGHILASQRLADDLGQYARWKPRIHELGECAVKHGVRLKLVNLYTDELGNRAWPKKFRIARQRRSMMTIAGILLLGIIAASTALFLHRPTRPGASESAIPEKSIAVLPFENLSEDKANAYFVAGIQDEVLTRLANLRELKVISRTSTRKYQSRPPNLRVIGEELGVSNILEGSVQKVANDAHINVQLIKASTDEHLWAQSYDRTLEHAFAVEGEVAQAVANELKIALLPGQVEKLHTPPTLNPQAYDSFLEGQYAVDQAWEASGDEANKLLESAVRSFKDAIAKDPGFALAYAQLAEAELTQYRFGVFSGHSQQMLKALDDAKSHIDRALVLAPNLAAAYAALGRWYVWGHSDYDAGLAEHKRAFALDPHLTEAIQGIAGIAQRRGRTSEAADVLTKAIEFDPRNVQLLRSLGQVYSMGREYTRAREVSARTLALNPSDEAAVGDLSDSIWKETGDLKAAERVNDSYLASLPPEKRNTSGILERKCSLVWLSRDFIGLQKLIESMPAEVWSNPWTRLEFIGAVHEELGDKEAARNFYQQARLSVLPAIAEDPDDPSKHAMLALLDAGLGLADEALAESHKAADLEPLAKNAMDGAQWAVFVALVNARLGRIDESIKLLQELLSTPGTGDVLSPWYLRLDPFWDSLRADPRFKKLIASP